MEKDSKHRPDKRPATVISGHWQQDAQHALRARARTDAQYSDDLEALAHIARSTIADLDQPDEPGASARLREASRRFAEFGETLRSAQGQALGSVNRFARRHPLVLAGGGVALGFALAHLLAKRRTTRHTDSQGGTIQ